MRSELRRLELRREVLVEGLAPRSGGNAARMLERTAPRGIMKAQLEQMGALQTIQ